LNCVFSGTLVQLASGLSEQCVKKQCDLAGLCFRGRMALDLSPLPSFSDISTLSRNWGEKGVKKIYNNNKPENNKGLLLKSH
jgi:hypothetical protein